MKNTFKKTLGVVLALALVLSAIGCSVAYADSYRGEGKSSLVAVEKHKETAPSLSQTPPAAKPSVESNSAAPAKEALTVEQAKAIALESLGLSDAHFTDVERDDGKYELELCDGKREYDVEVGISSYKVREIDRDHDACDACKKASATPPASKPVPPAADKAPTVAPSSAPTSTQLIGKDKAEVLAREALGTADLQLIDIELDDGKYEVEFRSGATEYTVDVHPTNENILKTETDRNDWDDDWDDRYDDDWDDDYDDDWDDRYDDDYDDDWDDRYDDDWDDDWDD